MNKYIKSTIRIILAVVGAVVIFVLFIYTFPKPTFTTIIFIGHIFKPKYKETTTIVSDYIWYECSKPIKVQKRFMKVGHLGGSAYQSLYLPVNDSDLKNFCRTTAIE